MKDSHLESSAKWNDAMRTITLAINSAFADSSSILARISFACLEVINEFDIEFIASLTTKKQNTSEKMNLNFESVMLNVRTFFGKQRPISLSDMRY